MTSSRLTDILTSYRKEFLGLLIIFIFSRIVVFAAGVRFDDYAITYGAWQLINPELLKTKLFESLFYLHSQPPLFNLYTGFILKFFPQYYAVAFHTVHLVLGILIVFTLFIILKKLNVRTWITMTITVLYMISPATILYENWLSYTYFIIALLSFAALSLLYFVETKQIKHGAIFFSILACLILTRSMYHIIWFFAVTLLLSLLHFIPLKNLLKAACIPLLLVLALFVKNYILFGTFSSSSWFGMSLSEIVLAKLPDEKKNKLIESGQITAISRKPAFWSIDTYKGFVHEQNPFPNIRVLTDTANMTHANLHNYHFIEVSEAYKRDVIETVKSYPLDYIKNVIISFGYYFHAASNHWDLRFNRPHVFWYNKLYNHLILGAIINPDELELEPPFQPKYLLTTSFMVVIFFVFGTIITSRFVLKNWKSESTRVTRTILLFSALTIVYVMMIGNFFEQGENMRFRFETITLCLIILGFTAEQLYLWYSKKKNG